MSDTHVPPQGKTLAGAPAAGAARDASLATRLEAAERALREAEERYRLLADNVLDMISLHDLDANFLFASPSSSHITGFQPVELAGRCVYDLLVPEDVPVLRMAHESIMRHEGRSPALFRAVRADGSIGWFESTARVVPHEETGEPWRIVAVTRDVTERQALEQHVRQASKMEALGRLSGGLAHDFNNILTVISGHAEMLLMRVATGPEREHAEHIREASHKAAALTRHLTSFGRRESDAVRLCDLNAVILDIQQMMTRLLGADIELVLELDPALHSIHADPAALEQVVVNLAANARDAMADGGTFTVRTSNIRIREDEVTALPPGAWVQLLVSDTGTGMDADVAARAFEPFFTTKADRDASGMGLSTVYGIMQQAGGSASVESQPGAGATVRLLFPAQGERATLTPDGRYVPAAGLKGSETVLVAEDDAGVRALIVATLQRYGYRVMAAVDGLQALDLFRTYGHLVDVIVTDVQMPEMKGPELVAILTASGATQPVLYMSGFTAHTLSLSESAPHRAFLPKPFTPLELGTALRSLLDRTT
ncbi:MAG TPA: PAS domain S-box protein [Longimicrobiales bacterium]|nr:PAS domain S-box protein [Longimicrobiales bacterium]